MFKQVIELWTDGGCRGNGKNSNIGAWGCYMVYKNHSKSICGGKKNTTNNEMELTGCIEGLKAIKNKNIPIIVYLDSNYVKRGITEWYEGWIKRDWKNASKNPVANKELWIELIELKSQFKDIKFVKVKGHSDNYGNIQADKLCNEYMNKIQNKT